MAEGELPWNQALLQASQAQEKLLSECEEEKLKLRVTIANLTRRLREARMRQENWLLRQQAWRAERADLLAKIGPAGKDREATRERLRFRFRDDGQ